MTYGEHYREGERLLAIAANIDKQIIERGADVNGILALIAQQRAYAARAQAHFAAAAAAKAVGS